METKTKHRRVWNGRVPPKAIGILHRGLRAGGAAWRVYLMPNSDDLQWINLKLAAVGPVRGSANFFVGWSTARLDFPVSAQTKRLQEYQPLLALELARFMRETWPTLTPADWALTDGDKKLAGRAAWDRKEIREINRLAREEKAAKALKEQGDLEAKLFS